VLGGIGLGLVYISPVSTLIKWFPDRPGMATGMAIMGFGGGAMIASPLATMLMARFDRVAPHGVAPTFVTMGALYFAFMMFGVFTVRVPREDWQPTFRREPKESERAIAPLRAAQPTAAERRAENREQVFSAAPGRERHPANVTAREAIKTPQFWLLWVMLCVNVTAGIGVLGQASPMIQEMFPGVITATAAA